MTAPISAARLRALAAKTGDETSPEWHVCEYPEDAGVACVESDGGIVCMEATNDKGEPSEIVASFVAECCPANVTALLDALRIAREALKSVSKTAKAGCVGIENISDAALASLDALIEPEAPDAQ